MKKNSYSRIYLSLTITFCFLCSSNFVRSQVDDFKDYPQFLSPSFINTRIKMKVGKDLNFLMNYNLITEKMVFLQKDQVYDLINQGTIDTIYMGDRKFISHEKVFYDAHPGKPSSLFIQHRGRLLLPPKNVAYGGTSDVSATTNVNQLESGGQVYNLKLQDDFKVKYDPIYWLLINEKMFSFVSEKQYLKIFTGKEDTLKLYIKKNKLKFDKPDDILKIWNYSNDLMK